LALYFVLWLMSSGIIENGLTRRAHLLAECDLGLIVIADIIIQKTGWDQPMTMQQGMEQIVHSDWIHLKRKRC